MTVISSQRYRDWDIIENKIEELVADEAEYIEVPVVPAYCVDDEGNELFIMTDKHHTLQAARELGLEVRYNVAEDELSYYADIEARDSEKILEAHYMDSNWYYIENENTNLIDVDVW